MAARGMSSRSYMSIGDVLSLLREEFPDVTISKIRFLESQGLVDPERSPSGYRKFYDDDVARLRWVLRKQRDQFLPLKVIRDRLAAAGTGVPPDDEPIANGEPAWRQGRDQGEEVEAAEPAHARAPAAGHRGARDAAAPGTEAGNGAADAPGWAAEYAHRADLEDVVEAPPVLVARGAPAAPAREGAGGRAGEASATATAVGARPREAHAAAPGRAKGAELEVEAPRRASPAGAAAASHPAHSSRTAGAARTETPPTGAPSAAEVLSPSVSGVSLTLAELCAATGLTPDVVASLEGLGLLVAMSIAGGTFYDEEALTVGKLVVEFRRYGVEPRHLRMYRNAVDREVGLVEQVITPLLRQRNPEARQRAVDAAADLARLGQSMRAALVRTELRRQLGG
jgi:DNA-binding transcriptional MerR regulator